jgi:hypothetical protein
MVGWPARWTGLAAALLLLNHLAHLAVLRWHAGLYAPPLATAPPQQQAAPARQPMAWYPAKGASTPQERRQRCRLPPNAVVVTVTTAPTRFDIVVYAANDLVSARVRKHGGWES